MSKKHFEAAAAKINGMVYESLQIDAAGNKQGASVLLNQAEAAARVFSSVAIEFNPRFDRNRFCLRSRSPVTIHPQL